MWSGWGSSHYRYPYYEVEGVVYDLYVSGGEAVLETSNGRIRLRVKGLSIKYLRVPSPTATRLAYLVFAMIIAVALVMGFAVFSSFSSPFSFSPWFFETVFAMLGLVFMALFIIVLVIAVSSYRPRPVLVVVDEAGVHHYYVIDSRSIDRVRAVVAGYTSS